MVRRWVGHSRPLKWASKFGDIPLPHQCRVRADADYSESVPFQHGESRCTVLLEVLPFEWQFISKLLTNQRQWFSHKWVKNLHFRLGYEKAS